MRAPAKAKTLRERRRCVSERNARFGFGCMLPCARTNLIWAYIFLLVAFYFVKKLSTIVLPSMYIILTYVQCLSIVGNRQGWGTKRTKARGGAS